ncbi:zinc finger protein 831 [Ctenodactylus gundi]
MGVQQKPDDRQCADSSAAWLDSEPALRECSSHRQTVCRLLGLQNEDQMPVDPVGCGQMAGGSPAEALPVKPLDYHFRATVCSIVSGTRTYSRLPDTLGCPDDGGMETPESTCPTSSARDQPASVSGPPGAPSGQASPRLSLGPVILPPEQSLPPTVFLKALPIPLYHTVPPGGLQPRAPLVTGSLDGGNVPFILSPLLQPEGTGPIQVGKPTAPALTVNIVGTLPVLSSGLGPTLGSPGKVRNAGKYLCPHCGRDCLKPSVLEKHIRSHTGERPFPCATCGIAFKTQSNLYKHRRTQTHLNNSRLSLESEGGGNNLLEEGDRAGDPSAADGRGDLQNQSTGKGPPGRPASLGGHLSKSLDVRTEAAPCQGSTLAHREGPLDSSQMVLPGLPLASTQPRRKLPEAKPCSLPRQQEASSEKPWDTKTSEGRLRKCESTDSGYLSRSDSVEQPLLPPSPLRSLSEHSAESEAEGGPGPGTGGTRAEPAVPGASLELEKKRLEERIAQLISHNQAVVDDPQLDHVRPRKTILSKQGSIDLPMPYTYKDSFHFDIRALEPGRRKTALSPARSTFTTLDKSRPLFFHSVPTQLSTTVECVPVTRSNSLPFVEGSRTWPEPRDLQDTCPRAQKPLSPRPTSGGLGCRSGLTLAEVSSGPTRALVRQAAVEDLPGTPAADALAPTEGLAGKRVSAGEGVVCKGRAASKKSSQRRLKMFSQEKWQVYGNETFKRIYQKMKASHQGSQKAREGRAGRREELDLPPQEEGGESRGTALSQDSRVPILRDTSIEAESGSWGIVPAQEGSVETEICTQRRTVTRAGSRDQPTIDKAVSTPTPTTRDPPCLGNRSLLLSPNGRLDLKWQLVPAPGTLQGHDPGDSRLVLSDPTLESGNADGSEVKETCLWTQTVLREPDGGSVEPSPPEDKLPSERKKLKVEGLGAQEQLEPRGEEAPGSPGKAASLPSQRQDSDPKEVSADIQESAQKAAECSLSSDTSSVAPAAALKGEGPGDQEPTLPLAVGTPGQRSQPASKPRAPSLLVTVPNNTFPPKYLLKMPQEDTPYPLPTSTRPMQDPHPLCARRPFENQATILNSKWGMPWSPGPASGLPAAEVDSIQKDPGCSRPKEARNEAQVGGEMGPETDTAPPATEQCPSSAAAAPWETASFPPVSTCDTPMAQDKGGETHTICCCTGSMSGRARSSGHVLSSWASNREPRSLPSPEEEPEDPSLQTPAELNPSCPSQPGSSLTRAQHMALGWPELPLSHDLGTLRSCGAQSPFPSLKAEPRLTWCCLSRSLPLPEEQKEKTASVYLALHVPGGHLHDGGPGTLSMSTGGWLSHLIVPGMRPQDQTSDSERKKGLSCRRVKMAHGNNKQKKMRINPKRHMFSGCFLHVCFSVPQERREFLAEPCSVESQQTAQVTLGTKKKLPTSFP